MVGNLWDIFKIKKISTIANRQGRIHGGDMVD